MSMSYPQQPVGQPAVPAQPAYQGTAPGYTPVPQGPVAQKVNRVSIILGVVGWALIGLTILAMWLAIRASASDPDPSGKEVIGFLPLFALMFIGPVNLAEDAEAQLAGNPPERKPIHRLHRLHDRSDAVHVGH